MIQGVSSLFLYHNTLDNGSVFMYINTMNTLQDMMMAGVMNDPAGSNEGNTFSIELAYVTHVSEDGHRVLVSPISNKTAVYEAIQLSPIPTSLFDGRRLQGVPTGKNGPGGEEDADQVICIVINSKYYIVGYYNLEDAATTEKISLVKDKSETLQPYRSGIMLKISDTASMIWRKANWWITYFSPWSNIDAQGEIPGDTSREAVLTTTWYNIKQRTWGGYNHWLRDKGDNTALESPATHTSMEGKYHEPDILSDVHLGQQEKNSNIDETAAAPGSNSPAPNRDNLNYVDKVIKRSGTQKNSAHVYEREVRQSKDNDKEKTVFTRLREGYREGVLSEYETIDTLLFTETREKRGIMSGGRVMSNAYLQNADADGTPQDSMVEEFGDNGTDVYNKVITHGDNSLQIQQTVDGVKLETVGTKNVTVNINFDGTVSIDAGDGMSITSGAAIDFNTGSGGFTVNGHYVLTQEFMEWMDTNKSALIMSGPPGSPAPIFPAALAQFSAQLALPDTFKTDKL